MEKLGFGIIGCGVIADFHVNAILENAEDTVLVGVADVNYERAKAFAEKHGTYAFASVEDMLRCPEISVVNICTPSGFHADAVRKAADFGKNIIVEKPLGITLGQLDDITEACENNGIVLSCISQNRFAHGVQMTKQALRDGLLGKLVCADIYMKYNRTQAYYDSSSWRGTKAFDGGGALMNQGIHGVDLLLYLAGPVKSVYALSKTMVRNIEVEDTLSAVVEYDSGAIGVIQATTSVYPGYPRRLELNGDRGTIVLDEGNISRWDIQSDARQDVVIQPNFTNSSYATPTAINVDFHARQIADVIRAIRTGTKPLVDVWEGRKAVELILAIYQSADEGRRIELH